MATSPLRRKHALEARIRILRQQIKQHEEDLRTVEFSIRTNSVVLDPVGAQNAEDVRTAHNLQITLDHLRRTLHQVQLMQA